MIDIYCHAASEGEGDARRAGAGVVLVWRDEHGRVQKRRMSFALSSCAQAVAERHALKLALASVAPANRREPTVIHTCLPSLADILTWRHDPDDTIRRWYNYFSDIQIMAHSDAEDSLGDALHLSQVAARSQADFDSKTVVETPDAATRPAATPRR